MTNQRESILRYAAENFGTTPEYLWKSTPDAAVLRHRENGKWYGLLDGYSRGEAGTAVRQNGAYSQCEVQSAGNRFAAAKGGNLPRVPHE